MRVLAHVHTLNDEAVIEQALEGLRRQTRPADGVIVVDNGSTDRTLDRPFPANVTVVRNSRNLGTSGAIVVGLAHAQEHGYDWAWLFDADSVPEPDALENLLAFFENLPSSEQERVCFLACRLINAEGEVRHLPMTFSDSTINSMALDDDAAAAPCDCYIWTGSLFRTKAVAKIGLPSEDYVLDVAELEYGYRSRQLGFTGYMVQNSVTSQDVGRPPGFIIRTLRFGPFSLRLLELSPIRCYYYVRNTIYFWLYQFRPLQPRMVFRTIIHTIFYPRSFALRPVSHRRHLIACLRGLWDGLTGNMAARY